MRLGIKRCLAGRAPSLAVVGPREKYLAIYLADRSEEVEGAAAPRRVWQTVHMMRAVLLIPSKDLLQKRFQKFPLLLYSHFRSDLCCKSVP